MRVTESSPLCALLLSRTDALLVKLSLLVGQQVFYGALWGSMLVTPMVRLPASVFIVTHFDRMASLSQQAYMLGYDQRVVVSASAHEILTYGYNSCHFSSLLFFTIHAIERLNFFLSTGEVTLSISARFKCLGAEEHTWNPALLFPICNMPGRHSLCFLLFVFTLYL